MATVSNTALTGMSFCIFVCVNHKVRVVVEHDRLAAGGRSLEVKTSCPRHIVKKIIFKLGVNMS
jgi:hypothetical protein